MPCLGLEIYFVIKLLLLESPTSHQSPALRGVMKFQSSNSNVIKTALKPIKITMGAFAILLNFNFVGDFLLKRAMHQFMRMRHNVVT